MNASYMILGQTVGNHYLFKIIIAFGVTECI